MNFPQQSKPVAKQQQAQKIARQALDKTVENPLKVPGSLLGEAGRQLTGDLENRQEQPDEREKIQKLEQEEKVVSEAQVGRVRQELDREIQRVRMQREQRRQMGEKEEAEKKQAEMQQKSVKPLEEPVAKQKRGLFGMFGKKNKGQKIDQLTSAQGKASAEMLKKTGG